MNYHLSDGSTNFGVMDIEAIASRMLEDPGARFLVWAEGMPSWSPAIDIPEIRIAFEELNVRSRLLAANAETVVETSPLEAIPESAPVEPRVLDQAAPVHRGEPADGHTASTAGSVAAPRKRRLGRIVLGAGVLLAIFVLIGVLFGKSTYERGVSLVGEGKYDEARSVFTEVKHGDKEFSKCAVGALVAEMGMAYTQKDHSKGVELAESTDEADGIRYYRMNIAPDDPLYPYASTLALLCKGNVAAATCERFLQDDPNSSDYETWFEGEGEISSVLPIVMKTIPSELKKYRAVDTLDQDIPWPQPFITSVALDRLVPPASLKSALDALVAKLRELELKVKDKSETFYREQERRALAGPLEGDWAVVKTWNMGDDAYFAQGTVWHIRGNRVHLNIVWPTGEREEWDNNWIVDPLNQTVQMNDDYGRGWEYKYKVFDAQGNTGLTLEGINGSLWQFVLAKMP